MGEPFRVIHRDVSPTNILISKAGQVKLIDFGIARQGNITPESRARPGKFTYMSPEQVRNQPLDGRSDIFCLGTILYEITLGRRLWRGTREAAMKRIVEERPRPPTFVRRDYPIELELIVLRALEKRPEDRYQSAAELHNDLQGYLMRSRAHLRSHSHMADYVAKIFSEEAEALISDVSRRRAQEFVDNTEVLASDQADLDFDAEQAAGPGAALARALRASALGVWAEPAAPLDEPVAPARGAVPKAEEAPVPEAAAKPVETPARATVQQEKVAERAAAVPTAAASKDPKPAAVPTQPASGPRAKVEEQLDKPPQSWAPVLVAAIVFLALVGAIWWLRGP